MQICPKSYCGTAHTVLYRDKTFTYEQISLIPGHRFYDAQGDPLPGLLTTLPTPFSCLSQLVHLDLSFNQLSCVPTCLLGLPTLSSLLLCQNRISELPADIGQLSSLTYLSLLGNKLITLPPSLGQLSGLRTLDVSLNLLQQLPDEIGSLGGLVKLELSQNKLRQLPESMGKCTGAKVLSFPCCVSCSINQEHLLSFVARFSLLSQGAFHLQQ